MQEEDYLVDSDFDEIKRNDRLNKISDSNTYFNSPIHIQHGDWKPTQNLQSHNKKYNRNRKISHEHPSYNKNKALIHRKHNYKKENESFFADYHRLKLKSRQKRSLGKFLQYMFA